MLQGKGNKQILENYILNKIWNKLAIYDIIKYKAKQMTRGGQVTI